MIERYTIQSKVEKIEKIFQASFNYSFQPFFNASPELLLPVITNYSSHTIQAFKWGFIPSWAKSPEHSYLTAPSENLVANKVFQKAIRNNRCLVPANCFFLWEKQSKKPYLVYSEETKLFAFAGIWNTYKTSENSMLSTFAIVTQEANDLVKALGHNQMPLILTKRKWREWLKEDSLVTFTKMMKDVYPTSKMNALPVSESVNDTNNNTKDILKPAGEKVRKEETFTPKSSGIERKKGNDTPFIERNKK